MAAKFEIISLYIIWGQLQKFDHCAEPRTSGTAREYVNQQQTKPRETIQTFVST